MAFFHDIHNDMKRTFGNLLNTTQQCGDCK